MGISILVIDDDSDDIELFREAVDDIDLGFTCQSALSGIEALTLLESGDCTPDIIFVDLNMPILSGKEFIGRVRENKCFDAIKLFLYSTIDLDKNVDLESINADGFFRKPISYNELCSGIAEIIQQCFNSAPASKR